MNAINPKITSTSKNLYAFMLPMKAYNPNIKYKNAWIGRRWFHHIFSPRVSGPCVLDPVRYMNANPAAMMKAT